MTNTPTTSPIVTPVEPGKTNALVAYLLFLLSIPSAGVFALIGVLVAYFSREQATGVWRTHLDDQVRVWAISFLWSVGLFVACLVGWILTIVLIGFAIIWLAGLGYLVLLIWFTVKSVLGLIALLEGRAP